MDFFGQEVFRPIATLALPGLASITPWIVLLLNTFSGLDEFRMEQPTSFGLIVFVFALVLGLIIEDIGSELEASDDEQLESKSFEKRLHMNEWYDYLANREVQETAGHRYLRSLVLRLKFELHLYIAAWVGSAGLAGCCIRGLLPPFITIVCIVLITQMAFFLRSEAVFTNDLLSRLRKELLLRTDSVHRPGVLDIPKNAPQLDPKTVSWKRKAVCFALCPPLYCNCAKNVIAIWDKRKLMAFMCLWIFPLLGWLLGIWRPWRG